GKDSKEITSAAEPSIFLPKMYSQFPPADAEVLPFFFKTNGVLSRKKKGESMEESAGGIFHTRMIRSSRLGSEIPPKTDMFSATVEPVGGLPRSLTFTAPAFESDVESMGPGEFSFFVSSQ